MEKLRVPIRHSLSYRQTRNAVIVAFAIGVILSSAQIYLDYFSQKSEIEDSVRNIVSTANRASYHAAFNLDETGAKQIARGLVSNAPIVNATITDHENQVLAEASRSDRGDISGTSRWVFGEPRVISIQLLNEAEYSEPVGILSVTVDPALTASSFIQRAKVVFLSGIVRNFILALCLITVFYYTTTRSILQATAPIQEGVTDRQIPMPESHRDDEIGVLIKAFNEHLAIIDEQTQQISDANLNLERLVEKRTHQLEVNNAELMRERELAIEASQAKSDFLAMMSHEIRTPMHGILGMAELLGESATSAEQEEYVAALTDSGRSLLTLMNSVLDYAKYEQGKFEFESNTFNVYRVVNGLVFLLNPTAEAKHLLLSSSIDAQVPGFINGDPEKLRQVLLNLLTNAIKFTETGSVELRVSRLDGSESQVSRLLFEVTDTGRGIPAGARDLVFSPFTQTSSQISRRFGGSGLGLSICKEIVTAQGGEIGFDSDENEGARFWFWLDFEIGTEPLVEAEPAPPEEPRGTACVLVVDDVEINRKLIEGQLASSGYRILTASNGEEALEAVINCPVDVVLMDLQMPVMDGFEATHLIRESDGPAGANLPILGITANLSPERREECLAAGMTDVIAKPIDAISLRSLLARTLSRQDERANGQPAAPQNLLDPSIIRQHVDVLGKVQIEKLYFEAFEIMRSRTSKILSASDGEAESVEREAHTLAGLCSSYGFSRMGQLCANLETALGDQKQSDAEILISELASVCDDTIKNAQEAIVRIS